MTDNLKVFLFLAIICQVHLHVYGQSGQMWIGAAQPIQHLKLLNIHSVYLLDNKSSRQQSLPNEEEELEREKMRTLMKRMKLLKQRQSPRYWFSRHGR